MTVVTLMAIVGIGGGFAVLFEEYRRRIRVERWLGWLIEMRRETATNLARDMWAAAFGCGCPNCKRERLETAVKDWNASLKRHQEEIGRRLDELKAAMKAGTIAATEFRKEFGDAQLYKN
jgi:hypothetical protein